MRENLLKIKIYDEICYGAPGGIRIPDLSVRSRMLYPAKLLVHKNNFEKSIKKLLQNYYILYRLLRAFASSL